ncbi:MAG: potassium channel family protein [Eubacteriales bacterium]
MNKRKSQDLYGIIGLGRFGSALAQTLAEAGKDVIVIDNNETKIKEACAFTDNAYTVSDLNKEVLQEVGIRNCDTVIVCIGEKIDTSILTTLMVLQLGVKRVISKAISLEQGNVLEMLGAEVVYPERDMAVRLAHKLISPRILEYISLSDEVDISEIILTEKIENMSVEEFNVRKKFSLNIIALKSNDTITTEILPNMILKKDHTIVVIGKSTNIQRLENYLSV